MTIGPARSLLGIFALTGCLIPCAAFADDDRGNEVYKSGLKSACYVVVPKQGSGSGSLIDAHKRYVITNNHVVGSVDTVIVHFPMHDPKGKVIVEKDKYIQSITSNHGIRGKVLVREETRDLAIIQLEKLPPGVTAVKLASDSPDVGDNIHSIGNPGASDAAFVYTPGKVRAVYEKKWVAGGGGGEIFNLKARIIEATSPTNPGDSGGPLFNSRGEQIGVTQGGLNKERGQGYSFFIDVTEIKNFLRDRKIVLSQRKDEPEATEVATQPSKPNPMTEPTTDPKKEVAKKDPPKKETPKVDTATAEQEALEKKASLELNLLKGISKDPNKRELAIEKLQALIKKYPQTDAAKQAKELVRRLDQ
jgi:S1-C subfamily serine protease